MTSLNYRVVSTANGESVTAFNPDSDTPIYQADDSHPHFKEIVAGLKSGDKRVFGLFDVAGGVLQKMQSITDRVTYDGKNILWDGDVVKSVLADQIKRMLSEGNSDYEAIAKFWEKLESNPNRNSIEQAYRWLATHDFKVTDDGDCIGYKGVNDLGDGWFESTQASRVSGHPSAYVDGRPQPERSKVKQRLGSVVSMPRSEVKDDPYQTCERGLHVADFSYAKSYGNATVMVVFNPRDIVSVPHDVNDRKVRVHKYTNVRLVTEELTGGPVVEANSKASSAFKGDVSYKV